MCSRILVNATLMVLITSSLFAQKGLGQKRVVTLSEAIKLGLKNSYTLEIQNEKIEQALSLQRKALALLLPQLTAQGTYTRYNKEVTMKFPELDSLQIITTPPYIEFTKYKNYVIQKENSFGAIANLNVPLISIPSYLTYLNSKESSKIAELNRENQRSELKYNISLAYLNAVSIKKGTAIAKNSIELAKSHLKIVETKFQNGEANELSLIKAQLDLERAQNDYERAAKAYNLSIESLSLLINTDKDFDVEDTIRFNVDTNVDVETALNKAISNRYDFKILNVNNEILKREIDITKSKFLPTLNMNATYRYSDMTSFIGEETQWFIIFSLNLNLYDGGIRSAEMREKKSRLRENEILLRQLSDTMRSQISQNIEELNQCKKNLKSLEKQLQLARRSYELSMKSYSVGVLPQADLIDSEIVVTNTELLFEKERNECLIHYIKLLKNTGEINSFEGD